MKKAAITLLLSANSIFGQQVKILQHQENVVIQKIPQLNSSYRECNLSVSPSGNELYFMSTRPSSNNPFGGNGDLYVSIKDTAGNWQNPLEMIDLNTSSGEDEPSISNSGNTIFYQSWEVQWKRTNGPYYSAFFKNGKFQSKIGLGGGINEFFTHESTRNFGYATDGMAISSDGKLFIVVCGPDYEGNLDMYYSVNNNGVWSYPVLFPASTRGDERAVFIAADNKTIYFSSDGYKGLGGLDIYKTTFENGRIGEVINIGAPFNSPENDMGFVITQNGNSAFLIRNLDIYFADLTTLKEEIKPLQKSETAITAVQNTSKEEKKSIAEYPKYAQYTVYFNFDSYSLNSEAQEVLNTILNFPEIQSKKISIVGHTDDFGSKNYNEILSKSRMNSVKNWLLKKGLDVTNVGFDGEKNPKLPNDNLPNRMKNRRVEIVIE